MRKKLCVKELGMCQSKMPMFLFPRKTSTFCWHGFMCLYGWSWRRIIRWFVAASRMKFLAIQVWHFVSKHVPGTWRTCMCTYQVPYRDTRFRYSTAMSRMTLVFPSSNAIKVSRLSIYPFLGSSADTRNIVSVPGTYQVQTMQLHHSLL